jgi:hypothetical protein
MGYVSGNGDWQGDEIVVPGDGGLLVLRFATGALTVSSFLHIYVEAAPVVEPRFANRARTVVDAWARTPERKARSFHLRCDLRRRTCMYDRPARARDFGRPIA